MGLDITAYSNAILLPEHEKEDGPFCQEHLVAYAYSGFRRSFRGLADADKQFADEFIGGRCYDVSASTSHAFRAGSYSGYNRRRNDLSGLFLGVEAETVARFPGLYDDGPFFELVNFADNEGCIGPGAARDLLADFEAGRERWAAECPESVGWYDDWTLACRLAADNGLIDFH